MYQSRLGHIQVNSICGNTMDTSSNTVYTGIQEITQERLSMDAMWFTW